MIAPQIAKIMTNRLLRRLDTLSDWVRLFGLALGPRRGGADRRRHLQRAVRGDPEVRDSVAGVSGPRARHAARRRRARDLARQPHVDRRALPAFRALNGERAHTTQALAREIVNQELKIQANCAARTHENDIRPIAEIVQKTGLPIEVAAFLGTSPIRRYTEGWTADFLLQTTEKAVQYAVSLGLEVMYVTEDTTRCDPDTVKQLNSAAINCGATPTPTPDRTARDSSHPPFQAIAEYRLRISPHLFHFCRSARSCRIRHVFA